MRNSSVIQFVLVCTVISALSDIRPGAMWNLRGDSYSGIEWFDKQQIIPTQKEIDQAIADCNINEATTAAAQDQAMADAKDPNKTPQQRIDALIKVIGE